METMLISYFYPAQTHTGRKGPGRGGSRALLADCFPVVECRGPGNLPCWVRTSLGPGHKWGIRSGVSWDRLLEWPRASPGAAEGSWGCVPQPRKQSALPLEILEAADLVCSGVSAGIWKHTQFQIRERYMTSSFVYKQDTELDMAVSSEGPVLITKVISIMIIAVNVVHFICSQHYA